MMRIRIFFNNFALQIPKVFSKVAHEVELGFIINQTCKNIPKENAMDYVGGYCLALDMTAQCELVDIVKIYEVQKLHFILFAG